jgi:hypothetical protein
MAALQQLPREIYDLIASKLNYGDLLNLTRATGLKPYVTTENDGINFVLMNREDEYLEDLYAHVWIKYLIKYKIVVMDKRQLKRRCSTRPSSCKYCNHRLCCKLIGCEECCDELFTYKYMFRMVVNDESKFILVMYTVLKRSISENCMYANRLHEYKHLKRDIARNLFRLTFCDFRRSDIRFFNFCIHVLK